MDLANVPGKIDMKRKWNWPLWVGFVVVVGGLFSYAFFAQFPITRDFPWANLSLFGIGAALLMLGLFLMLEIKAERVADPEALSSRMQSEVYALPPLPTARSIRKRSVLLRNLLRVAAGSRVEWRAACWAKSAGLYTTGSKWKACWSRQLAFRFECCCADFLSRLLVTTLQLRVAEFPADPCGL